MNCGNLHCNCFDCWARRHQVRSPEPRKLIRLLFVTLLTAGLLLFLFGCKTLGVKEDSFPPEIAGQCVKARADAITHYRAVWHEEPATGRPVKVLLTDNPPQGYGGLTRASGGGYIIELWRKQTPFFGSLVHEFGHTLKLQNGKGGGEGGL